MTPPLPNVYIVLTRKHLSLSRLCACFPPVAAALVSGPFQALVNAGHHDGPSRLPLAKVPSRTAAA